MKNEKSTRESVIQGYCGGGASSETLRFCTSFDCQDYGLRRRASFLPLSTDRIILEKRTVFLGDWFCKMTNIVLAAHWSGKQSYLRRILHHATVPFICINKNFRFRSPLLICRMSFTKQKILVDDYKVCLGLSKQELMNINSSITPNDR